MEKKKICFVIQPFDNGTFDKRYTDIFKPAILEAGLEPYRIDEDVSSKILIEDIEKKISESTVCFAEITSDNPNVWYELGFAFACRKDVVMVCSKQRADFPFDVRHKSIIKYGTDSSSDYDKLRTAITQKLNAFKSQLPKFSKVEQTEVGETEDLKDVEIAILGFLVGECDLEDDHVSVYRFKNKMMEVKYNNIEISLGLRVLKRKNMIKSFRGQDPFNNEEYSALQLTEEGLNWILENEQKIIMRHIVREEIVNMEKIKENIPPF